MRSARRSTASSSPTTCASRRAASRRSCRSTTWKAPSGTTPRCRRPSARSADALARKLKARLAPGGLLHDAQGKWYPGEPLPRWAIGIFWRNDGTPLWRDPKLLADPSVPGTATFDDAQRFAQAIAKGLGVPASSAIVAFEDVPKLLRRKRRSR
jgi:uncharacterized protein (DUF2126 family)